MDCCGSCGSSFEVENRAENGAPLGTSAKSQAIVDFKGIFDTEKKEFIDQETGEFFKLRVSRSGYVESVVRDPVSIRIERYALQSVVRSLLYGSRTVRCLRVRQGGRDSVNVFRSLEHGSASYGGLQTCGSVWACPVCAAKISERRRVELQQAIEAWKATGGAVVLLTLTHPHTKDDPLLDLLVAEQKALTRFFDTRSGKALMVNMGRVGHIRAWEVTHGRQREINNGWHPHFHILLFLDRERSRTELKTLECRAFEVWANACRLSGLDKPSREHGVTIENGSKAAAYASKWGLENEMTKGHIKRALAGETPFDLLRAVLEDKKDDQARSLFREYAHAFKGKRQLVWSRGLRDLFNLGDASSDEELATTLENDAELLGSLDPDQWRAVLKHDFRAELLELARHGWEPVQRMLDGLMGNQRIRGGIP
jgi:hypothetical protein